MPTADDYEWFRARVRERRTDKGWSINRAAAKSGVTAKTWSNTEKGTYQAAPGVRVPHTPDPETVAKIAAGLGIVGEANERFADYMGEVVRTPIRDQLKEIRVIVLEVARRMDEIEDQIDQ